MNIAEWISFYDKEYEHVGFLEGTYYDIEGKPTLRSQEVAEIIENARLWKIKRANQEEAFPSCNSEWKKGVGGRVWCSTKSGGIKREWVIINLLILNT